MSNIADMGLDLENLFQPAWAQGKSEANRFEKFTGTEGVRPERKRSDHGPRREGGFGERRGGEGRPPRAGGFGRPGERKGGPRRDDRRDDRRDVPREPVEPTVPLPELNVAFIPEEKGVEQLARQIRMTGRAYPLFQIAQLILQKGERYSVQLTAKKKADGNPVQFMYVCALDDTPWCTEEEAVAHVLKNHFATFYQIDRTPCDPPKGVYTFVAQCGMSGVVLGPPNYHDYQNQLRKLHAEKFARMPFDMFKSRVKIVKDEAVVKKWIEDQSFKTEYTCLNVPEPLKLPSLEEVEKHFRATYKDSIIKPVETCTVIGTESRTLRSSGLQRLIRQEWEHQRHFPLPVATRLSQQFAGHGLQFFKVDRTYTHVSVARPQFLDVESSPVSDGIKRIVQYIDAHPKCKRKQLIESLAPTPKSALKPGLKAAAPAPAPVAAPAPAPTAEATAAETPAPAAETVEAVAPLAAGAIAPTPAKPAEVAQGPEPTPEQTAVMMDLHWLIHQGAVLEFADGRLETAKKPLPKPPKPEKKVEAKPEAKPVTGEAPAAEATPATGETPAVAETASATTEAAPAAEVPVAAAAATPEPTAAAPAPAAPAETPASAPTPAAPAAEPSAPATGTTPA